MEKTSRVYVVLNATGWLPGTERRWVNTGEPVLLTPTLALTVYADRTWEEEGWVPRFEFATPDAAWMGTIPPEHAVKATPWASMYLVPRAIELVNDRPQRVLVDVVHVAVADTGRGEP